MVKTITINDSAYDSLKRLKRTPKDSFSKVILRLTGSKGTPLNSAGLWLDKTQTECDALITRSRSMFEAWGSSFDAEDQG